MEQLTYFDIAKITGGNMNFPENFPITGAETDSRRIQKGDLYAAIVGARVDGHDFIEDAAKAGAVSALVSRPVPSSIPLIIVPSVEDALHQLAKTYLATLAPYTVAVTGSAGKTTTKEMLFEVFATRYAAAKTQGNFNSTIGLPLTVCRLDSSVKAAVLEMGTGGKGEIPRMCDIVHPDIAVITNIGTGHIEHFGSREGIRDEKTALFRAVKPGGVLVVNADDDMLCPFAKAEDIPARKITFGLEHPADVTAKNILSVPDEVHGYRTEFDLCYQGRIQPVILYTLGNHNVTNALAAAAAGIAADISLPEIAKALAAFLPDEMRMKVTRCKDGVTLISDVYNSNPEAAKAALDSLASAEGGRKIAILGDMLEQGAFSQSAHLSLGQYAAAKASVILAKGSMSEAVIQGAASGLSYKNLHSFATNENVVTYLTSFEFYPDDVVLVKGSRGMKMEKIVHYIKTKRFEEV